ncbi:MAG: YfhO family protein, partial [Leptospiraceae bacterium]|nr:YfhO family protein [Leptospiraceae bacterium]
LITLFTKSRLVLFFSLLFMGTISSTYAFLGFGLNNLLSYLPLFFYFYLKFLGNLSLKYFLICILILVICFVNSPVITVGYFYMPMHFFILISFVYIFIRSNSNFLNLIQRYFSIKNIVIGIVVFSSCLIILLPYLEVTNLLSDINPANVSDRKSFSYNPKFMVNIMGPSLREGGMNIYDFIPDSISTENHWWKHWIFLGLSTFILSCFSICFIKIPYKWLFAGTVYLQLQVVLIDNINIFLSIPKWIQALTNPFAFLLRSFHMTTVILTMYYFPLIFFGIYALLHSNLKSVVIISKNRIIMFMILLVTIYYMTLSKLELTNELIISFLFISYLFCVVFYSVINGYRKLGRITSLILLLFLFYFDYTRLSQYYKNDYFSFREIIPRDYNLSQESSNPIIPDYQNPEILPLRNYIRTEDVIPELAVPQNFLGLFHGFIPMMRYIDRAPYKYHPRHEAFVEFHRNRITKKYLRLPNIRKKFMYTTKYAALNTDISFESALEKGISPNLVIIEKNSKSQQLNNGVIKYDDILNHQFSLYEEKYSEDLKELRFHIKNKFTKEHFIRSFSKDGKILFEYSVPIPPDFPQYIATPSFTLDANDYKLSIGTKKLKPVQGVLNTEYTFDLQNYKKGYLTFVLPQDFNFSEENLFNLEIFFPKELKKILINQHDRFGFTYEMEYSGWLIVHTPWDDKMKIKVNGIEVEKYKANTMFMALKLEKGNNDILMEYLPNSWLRELFFISNIFVVFSVMIIFLIGFFDKKSLKYNEKYFLIL